MNEKQRLLPAVAGRLVSMFGDLKAIAGDARAEIEQIDRQIAELREQRAPIEVAPLHIDDVVRLVGQAIDGQREYFARRVHCYLHGGTVSHRGADGLSSRHRDLGIGLFHVHTSISTHEDSLPIASESTLTIPPDVQGLLAVLGPVIKTQLPDFLLGVCPELAHGVPLAERDAKLAEIDAKLRALHARRAEITNALLEAGKTVTEATTAK